MSYFPLTRLQQTICIKITTNDLYVIRYGNKEILSTENCKNPTPV